MSQARDVQRRMTAWPRYRGRPEKKRPAFAGQLEFWLGCERSCDAATDLDVTSASEMRETHDSAKLEGSVTTGLQRRNNWRSPAV